MGKSDRNASNRCNISIYDDPVNRDWGSAAAAVAGCVGGVELVRVHEIRGTVEILKVADAIWNC